jgi:hypothetical protein
LFLSRRFALRAALFQNRRWFGARFSIRGRHRGERHKTEHAGKSFQQGFSRMAAAAVSRKWFVKSGEIGSCGSG